MTALNVDSARGVPRVVAISSGAFLTAAIAVAIARGITPFDHGWWLVAFLGLVGWLAQWLLAVGLVRAGRDGDAACGLNANLGVALWTCGTLVVAVSDLAGFAAGVLIGSVVLLITLVLCGRAFRDADGFRQANALSLAYGVLLVFLAVSVFTGMGLASALPGQ